MLIKSDVFLWVEQLSGQACVLCLNSYRHKETTTSKTWLRITFCNLVFVHICPVLFIVCRTQSRKRDFIFHLNIKTCLFNHFLLSWKDVVHVLRSWFLLWLHSHILQNWLQIETKLQIQSALLMTPFLSRLMWDLGIYEREIINIWWKRRLMRICTVVMEGLSIKKMS